MQGAEPAGCASPGPTSMVRQISSIWVMMAWMRSFPATSMAMPSLSSLWGETGMRARAGGSTWAPHWPPPGPPGHQSYLLALVDRGQRRNLAVLVRPEDLAEGAGGRLAAQAVDVDPLVLVLLAHGVLPLLQGPAGESRAAVVTSLSHRCPRHGDVPIEVMSPSW